MEERISRVGRAAWMAVGLFVLALCIGAVGWAFRVIFPPLVLAGALVFLLNPIVSRLHKHGVPRLVGTAVAFAFVAMVFGGLGLALYPLVSSQTRELAEQWPDLQSDIETRIDDLSRRSDEDNWAVHLPSVKELEDNARPSDDCASPATTTSTTTSTTPSTTLGSSQGSPSEALPACPSSTAKLGEQVATLRDYAVRVFHVGIIFVIGPFLAFYLLVDLPVVKERVESLIPESALPQVRFLAHRLNDAIGGFFRGQLMVAVIVGVLCSIGLWVIGLPLWLVIGMLAGTFNMIPLVGPWVGAIPGVLLALTTRDLKTAILVCVVMAVVQQIDNHFITPTVMRRAVQLHPAAVMLALLAWGTLGGFFGLLLAVPITATIKIIGGHLWRRWVMGVSVPGLDIPHPGSPEEAVANL